MTLNNFVKIIFLLFICFYLFWKCLFYPFIYSFLSNISYSYFKFKYVRTYVCYYVYKNDVFCL